ncbi:metalloregulator ArsR/SmtB family transcription factor [Acinetobacter faecalis]|uniref:metalloregulator ArsR/SmtB family transcription factor n=1 Tax=Acinetobacter faecalis TaxID=2665161 RepID=UPI002A90C1DB|nr:metalloregulator ArsR/SmtB family transcription factor [Acinetobacter faecalis]MDY6456820.1 metalloregulator ArsR/SmtB family transcription factor [Acinetobacter faecalis]
MNPVDFFKALSDETRLNIIMLVAQHEELCVCDLTVKLDLSQPKISRHLALLRTAKILGDRRQGQWVYYRLHPELQSWQRTVINEIMTLEQFQALNSDLTSTSTCCE